ncbi:hypothetical protein BGZ93_000278 [Podila epicladia]|nr:hypothetical protein BGZ92_011893 [Podila epicladia]KAG0098375.1 hypothetical protein BGZ93_000278 [Podila epicladia]
MSLGANNGCGGGWVTGNLIPSPAATRAALVDANSTIVVTLQDVSLMDVSSTEIGRQTIKVTKDRNFPIAFRVGYDPKKVAPMGARYTVSGAIYSQFDLLTWVSDTATFVITKGNPTKDVKVVLQDLSGRSTK